MVVGSYFVARATGHFDAAYMMDAVNRLTRALEGQWSGSAVAVATRDEVWTCFQFSTLA
jgi:hypothetical protein